MSGFVKRIRYRQKIRERATDTPGAAVPGTGRGDNHKPHRRHLRMKPYERPRKGGKEDITS